MNHSETQLLKIKENLENCYRSLPDQFALAEVKNNLRKTLESIRAVENKRNKRKLQEQQNSIAKMAFTSYESAQTALDILNQMYQDEQKVIDDANKPQPKNSISDYDSGDMLLG